MRLINKWSYSCAKCLSMMLDEDHHKKAIYYYGFQIAIGSIIKIIFLIAVSLAFGVLLPALTISFSFAIFRKFAGGYHMKTYDRCLCTTIGLFVTSALIARYTYEYWSVMGLIVLFSLTFVVGIYILIRYAPKDTPNRLITNQNEIMKFKILSVIYIFAWLALVIVLTVYGLKLYALSLFFSVILELFGITPTGYGFFEKIESRLTSKRKLC